MKHILRSESFLTAEEVWEEYEELLPPSLCARYDEDEDEVFIEVKDFEALYNFAHSINADIIVKSNNGSSKIILDEY
nr:MAG TPA: hypothetical protein [Caudoviricetes sp.]